MAIHIDFKKRTFHDLSSTQSLLKRGLWLQLLTILVWTENWFSLDPSLEISTELSVPQRQTQKQRVRHLPKTLISP